MSGHSIIVAGATGAIGRTAVQQALLTPTISRVVALTRSADTARAAYPKLFGIFPAAAAAAASGEEEKATTAGAAKAGDDGKGGDAKHGKGKKTAAEHELHLTDNAVLEKLVPVTFDWEAFATDWQALRQADGDSNSNSNSNNSNSNSTGTLSEADRKALIDKYAAVFSGHHYAAMCLGTTRADAGSAAAFIRCDYDYVIAFTEACLAFSAAPVGLVAGQQQQPKGEKASSGGGGGGFCYRLGDGTKKSKHANAAAATAVAPGAPLATWAVGATPSPTSTLAAISQVSSYNADSGSWFLYMCTKGCADEAVLERVHAHNSKAAAAAAAATAASNSADKGSAAAQQQQQQEEKKEQDAAGPSKQEASPLPTQSAQGGDVSSIKLSFIRPGLLERHEKSRGNESLAKYVMSGLPVEWCGRCAVKAAVSREWGANEKQRYTTVDKKVGRLAGVVAEELKREPFFVFTNKEIKPK